MKYQEAKDKLDKAGIKDDSFFTKLAPGSAFAPYACRIDTVLITPPDIWGGGI